MSDVDRIAELVRRGRKFLVSTHLNPDGDAIGSELALYHLLRHLAKDVFVINHDPVPQNLRFLPGAGAILTPQEHSFPYDATFMLDCGQFDRGGSVTDGDRAGFGSVVNIDHHATGGPWGDLNWTDPTASSTAELVYRLITTLLPKPSLDMACCVYTGMMTDTGSFRYSNTSSRVLSLASELVAMGIEPSLIATHVYENIPFATLKLLGLALSSLAVTEDGLVSWICLSDADIRKTGASWADTEEFINYPRSIPTVAVALFFKRHSNREIKVSLRSRGRIDVARLALRHGGGGHVNAAGFSTRGRIADVIDRVIGEVRQEVVTHQVTGSGHQQTEGE